MVDTTRRQAINNFMKMRDLMTITESPNDGWTVIQHGTPDVTGDDAQAALDDYNAHDLVDKSPADPGDSYSRNIYTYMNAEKTFKVVLSPSYDGGNGEYFIVSVYQRS